MIKLHRCYALLGGTALLPRLQQHSSTAAGSTYAPSAHLTQAVGKSRKVSNGSASHHPADEFDRVVGRPDRRNLRCGRAVIDRARLVRQDLQT
jgi:hypothetical protein